MPSEGGARWLRETMNSCWHAATKQMMANAHKALRILELFNELASKKSLTSSQAPGLFFHGLLGAIPWPSKESPQKASQVCKSPNRFFTLDQGVFG